MWVDSLGSWRSVEWLSGEEIGAGFGAGVAWEWYMENKDSGWGIQRLGMTKLTVYDNKARLECSPLFRVNNNY